VCAAQAADVDGDGTLNYEEFLAAMVHAGKLDREELLQQVFEQFDTDGSGSITRDELQQASACKRASERVKRMRGWRE
jgi:calcium-dependent protein kinase